MAKKSKVVKNKISRKKHPNRVINRCSICGRPRGYIRFVGLCRLCFRKLANSGDLPGVVKSSW